MSFTTLTYVIPRHVVSLLPAADRDTLVLAYPELAALDRSVVRVWLDPSTPPTSRHVLLPGNIQLASPELVFLPSQVLAGVALPDQGVSLLHSAQGQPFLVEGESPPGLLEMLLNARDLSLRSLHPGPCKFQGPACLYQHLACLLHLLLLPCHRRLQCRHLPIIANM